MARRLLQPTRIYVRSLMPLIQSGAVTGLAHITGSGFLNVPRISDRVSYAVTLPGEDDLGTPVWEWVRKKSKLPLRELAQTFNLGVGMVVVVKPAKAKAVLGRLRRSGETAWDLGEVLPRKRGKECEVTVTRPGQGTVRLEY